MLAVWQIDVRLTGCSSARSQDRSPSALEPASGSGAQPRRAQGPHHLAYSPRCRASSPPGIRPGSWGIAMPSSTAVSLAASPEQIAPEMAALLHESDITLMRTSGERYSEERRPLLLSWPSQRVQEVVYLQSLTSVSCRDSTQNSVWPCAWRSKGPIKTLSGRSQDFQATPRHCQPRLNLRPIDVCLHAL
jgi:hypothetical protein